MYDFRLKLQKLNICTIHLNWFGMKNFYLVKQDGTNDLDVIGILHCSKSLE